MRSAQILKEKINSGKLTVGVIATHHFWIDLIEIVRNAGMDYLIIDTEHMNFDDELLGQACALGRMIDFPIILRPAESEYTLIRRALDKGAVGLFLPQVQTSSTMDQIRDAIYMPPRGKRRVGGPGNRWVPDFNYPTWKRVVEDDVIILPQIESLVGLENVDAIARDPMVTALAAGPYDLSTELGVCWEPESPKLIDALARIRRAATDAGKNMLMVGDGPTMISRGFNFICIAEPSAYLEAALKNHVAAMRTSGGKDTQTKAFVP